MELINQWPAWIGVLYLAVEALKVYLPYRAKNKEVAKGETEKTGKIERDDITDCLFQMYDMAKGDLETEKSEIKELTKTLKKANTEINLLERKIAALMRVLDDILKDGPNAHNAYLAAMRKYKNEIEENVNV
ncbi:MAG: hypothetical protein GY810_28465 [Aureispira sp.]|nr:hypothetical protein [Aureispira sp.]